MKNLQGESILTVPTFLRQHFITEPEVTTYFSNIQGEIAFLNVEIGGLHFSHIYSDFKSTEDDKTYYLGLNDIDFDCHIPKTSIDHITYDTDEIGQEDVNIILKNGTKISIGIMHEEFRSCLEVVQ